MSSEVVTKAPVATAGSIFILFRTIGVIAPIIEPIVIAHIIERQTVTPIYVISPWNIFANIPNNIPYVTPSSIPILNC